MKFCCGCDIEKPLDKFSLKRGKPNSKCKVCVSIINKVYRESNPEKWAEYSAKHWKRVKGSPKQVEANRKKCTTYRKAHPHVFRYHTSKYRATKLQATPSWANLDKIHTFYLNCPEGFHVDHIIPLQGELVSGLHTIENLQYLSALENIQKSNNYLI